MSKKWVVVGISGATCSGKSTLAKDLHTAFPQSICICQDDYFFPTDSPNHIKVEELGHLNWEIMTSLDMDSMRSDVHNLLAQDPLSVVLPSKAKRSQVKLTEDVTDGKAQTDYPFILILEGFLLLNDKVLSNLCDLRYYLTLHRDQCWERRRVRVYDPPDIPGYFDLVVWPEYLKHRDEVLGRDDVVVFDGMNSTESIMKNVLKDVQDVISKTGLAAS